MYIGKPIYVIKEDQFHNVEYFENILDTTIIYTDNGKSYDISEIEYIDVESIQNEKDEMKKIIKELLFDDSNELGWLKFKIDIKYEKLKNSSTSPDPDTSWMRKVVSYLSNIRRRICG
jgi:hypothetical protein